MSTSVMTKPIQKSESAISGWLRLRSSGRTSPNDILKFSEAQDKSGRVDLEVVVRRLGIGLKYNPALDYDGHCIFSLEDDEAEITFNPGVAPVRRRFTIAHEIGHIMLHPPGQLYRDIVQIAPSKPIEVEANRFAAALLMPTTDMYEFLRHRVSQGLSMPVLAGRIADLYDVSVRAAEIRLDSLAKR